MHHRPEDGGSTRLHGATTQNTSIFIHTNKIVFKCNIFAFRKLSTPQDRDSTLPKYEVYSAGVHETIFVNFCSPSKRYKDKIK